MHGPASYFLRTTRLGLRRWTEEDRELAHGLWGDLTVTELIDARGALTRRQTGERLLDEISTGKAHGVQYWPIVHADRRGARP